MYSAVNKGVGIVIDKMDCAETLAKSLFSTNKAPLIPKIIEIFLENGLDVDWSPKANSPPLWLQIKRETQCKLLLMVNVGMLGNKELRDCQCTSVNLHLFASGVFPE